VQQSPGGSAVLDECGGLRGQGLKLSIKNSPGRGQCVCSVECVTPASTRRPVASRCSISRRMIQCRHDHTLTFNGINYSPRQRQAVCVDGSLLGEQLPARLLPGRERRMASDPGRFEWGDRAFAVQFVVPVQAGSTEYSNLILTTGTPRSP